jgi:hypothetical protein
MKEPEDSLKNLLSGLIALAAVTAALVSWQASRVNLRAASADGKALTAALDEASTELGISSDVFINQTNAREFLRHRENGRAINEEYLKNPDVPPHWLDEWQSEMIRARARYGQLSSDFLKTEDGLPVFEDKRYRETTRAQAAVQKAIDPSPFLAEAAGLRRRGRGLIELNVLFTLAIFLFTIALKIDVRRKLTWTAVGAGLYLAATGIACARIFF